MPQFQCRVMTDTGKVIDEVFTAESKEDLILSFRSRKYRPISVKEEVKSLAEMDLGSKKMKQKSLILFCRQMSTLLRSGVPLVKSFDIIAGQTDDKIFKQNLSVLSSEVQTGNLLSAALEKMPDQFPPMLAKMVGVGEATGDMAMIMDRMASQYESNDEIKRKVKGSMAYPIALVFIALIACVFMLIAIVPRFVDIFDTLGADLPVLTKILLTLSDFITNKWYLLVLALPIVILLFIRFLKRDDVSHWIDGKMLTIKLIKDPVQKLQSTSFARTLYTLVSSGIPIVQAMEYTRQNVSNTVYQDAIAEIAVGLQKGKGLSEQMSKYNCFPTMLVSMISIGEASGNLEEMLQKTADYYDSELDATISQLMTLVEPLMICIVGVLIGGIVMALYAPMFGVISAMSGSL